MADKGLADLFLATDAGKGLLPIAGGNMTAWNSTTYANTVSIGTVDYTNLPVVNPAALSTGRVLCLLSQSGPIVLGRIYQP